MPHKCAKCLYFYLTEKVTSKEIYNPLSGIYENWPVDKKMSPACGITPGGVFLDEEQPKCADFKE